MSCSSTDTTGGFNKQILTNIHDHDIPQVVTVTGCK